MKFLSPVDTAWYRLDEGRNTADIVALITFAERLDAFHVVEIIETRFSHYTQFCSRVVDPLGAGLPHWEEVEDFRITDHIHQTRLGSGTMDELQDMVGTILTQNLKRDRPLWEIHIVDNVGEGGAIIAKIHHCLGDGFALVDVLLSLSDTPTEVETAATHHDHHEAHTGLLEQLQFGAKVAAGIAELMVLPFDTPSSLVKPLTGVRRAAWSDAIPLSTFKNLAKAHHCTVNDVLLSALTGALRKWLATHGDSLEEASITAIVPVNLRPEGQSTQELGNQFGLVFLGLPVRKGNPLEHLADIHESMCAIKDSVLAASSVVVLGALGLMPDRLEHLAADVFTRKGSLVVTNVPGPRERIQIAGKEVDHLMFWVPHAALLGLGVSLLSYAGEVRIGVRVDTGMCEHPETLIHVFHEAIDALVNA